MVSSLKFETPALLQRRMSESKIMSVFRLVIPYTFKRWFKLPTEDMFNELQFIVAKVNLGTRLSGFIVVIEQERKVSK